ncbi:MAG: hypothetical protein KAT58_08765 [candidate division Zixibacteria bacterium]|nr:hypothetical protein [candidate division Zixibacteria bacterium]
MEADRLLYEVEFKAFRRQYCENPFSLDLYKDQWVIVEAERGEDMGFIHQPINRDLEPKEKLKGILRVATYEDQEKLHKNREMEADSMICCQEMIDKHHLDMKLVDVEYQFDCNKLTFYFTADQRVDFRALVKDLAATYHTRIELRQIGVRDEARRLGGFGVCGLQQCCNSFIRNFEPISTQLARDQNLSLNPAKISGNCGRLLCCLAYEHKHYIQAVARFPDVGSAYQGEPGRGVVEAINVFHQFMVVRYEDGTREKISLLEYGRHQRKGRTSSEKSVGEKE